MLNLKKFLTILGLASMTVLTACGATTSADGDATGSDATTGTDATGTDAATGDTGPAVTYKSVVIWDKSQDPGYINGKCGASPGTDLDAIGLYRNNVLIGVGKPGTAIYTAPATASPCTVDAGKSKASSAEGPLDAHVYASSPDTGYISLNGGSLEMQFGACVSGTTITTCDGAGALIDILPGDQLDVWEVDTTYKAGSGTPADGNAYSGCVCYADEYQVDLRPTLGSEAGSVYVPSDPNQYDKGSMTVAVP